MKIYISSSWKNRDTVRQLAVKLREYGHEVYDFTDPNCRKTPGIPPEKIPVEFNPAIHKYSEYINKPEWKQVVMENKQAIIWSDFIILLLPCGSDSHADWALGVGLGKRSVVVGQPCKGERSWVHHWADRIFNTVDDFICWFTNETMCIGLSTCGGGCESCLAAH